MVLKRFGVMMALASVLILMYFGISYSGDSVHDRSMRSPLIFYKTNGDVADTSGAAKMKIYSSQYAIPADTAGHHSTLSYTASYDGFATWYDDNITEDIYNCFYDSAGVVSQLASNYFIAGRALAVGRVGDSLAFVAGVVGTAALLDGGVKPADLDSACVTNNKIAQSGADQVGALIDLDDIYNVGAMTEASGDVLYYTGNTTNKYGALAIGTEGYYLQSASGIPAWAAIDHGSNVAGLGDDDHTQYILHTELDTWDEFPAIDSGKIIIGSNISVPTALAISVDATLNYQGKLEIVDDSHAHTASTISGLGSADFTDFSGDHALYLLRADGADWADSSRTGVSKISADNNSGSDMIWHVFKSGAATGDAVEVIWRAVPYAGIQKTPPALRAWCDTGGRVDFTIKALLFASYATAFASGADSLFAYTVVTPAFTWDSAR